MNTQRAFFNIAARHTIAGPAIGARAAKRARRVTAGRKSIARVHAEVALVDVEARHAVARVANVASAHERAARVRACRRAHGAVVRVQ